MNSIVALCSEILAGVTAGEEFIVRWGLQPATSALPDGPHLVARQAMVRRLRVVVPFLMLPTVALSIWSAIAGLAEPASPLPIAAATALLVFMFASLFGTVPINIKVNDWDPRNLPDDWKAVVRRWEQFDVRRSSAALVGFVLAATALSAAAR